MLVVNLENIQFYLVELNILIKYLDRVQKYVTIIIYRFWPIDTN